MWVFALGFLTAVLLEKASGHPVLFRVKRFLKGALIAGGVLKPGAKGRHGWVGPIRFTEEKRRFQIDFLKKQGLLPHHTVLDFGCGTLRGGLPMIAYLEPGNYCGVDVRPVVLEEARKELLESGLASKSPRLVDGAAASRELQGVRFDRIWAFNVLIHASDSVLRESMDFIAAHLKEAGVFFATVSIGKRLDTEWQGFPFVTRPLWLYEDEAARCRMKLGVIGTLDSFGYGFQDDGRRAELIMLEMIPKKIS